MSDLFSEFLHKWEKRLSETERRFELYSGELPYEKNLNGDPRKQLLEQNAELLALAVRYREEHAALSRKQEEQIRSLEARQKELEGRFQAACTELDAERQRSAALEKANRHFEEEVRFLKAEIGASEQRKEEQNSRGEETRSKGCPPAQTGDEESRVMGLFNRIRTLEQEKQRLSMDLLGMRTRNGQKDAHAHARHSRKHRRRSFTSWFTKPFIIYSE